MCASTLCPFSSSTRNCVLGSASVTVPSTSMTSSLANDLLSQTVTRWLEPNGYLITPAPLLTPRIAAPHPPSPPLVVSTQGPFSVTATVCSKWAASEPSAV